MNMAHVSAAFRSIYVMMGEVSEAVRELAIASVDMMNETFILYLPCTVCDYLICEHPRHERSKLEQRKLRVKLHRRRLNHGRMATL